MPRLTVSRALILVPTLILMQSCGPAKTPAPALPPGTPEWLVARATEEHDSLTRSDVMHDFRFTDALPQSGIQFVNRFVDDVGKNYKAIHYDHGTALAAADVNGDGLTDFYFVSQLGTSELWRNIGSGKFSNITADAGLSMPDAIAVGASFADIDNDGDADLFVSTVRHGNRLFENIGDGKFRDITAQAGVGYVGHSSGAVFFDYDRDGLLDLFVTNVGAYTTNVKGRGGYFIGMTDAFVGHVYADRADESILYHNLGGGRFKDVTRETGLRDTGWSGDAAIVDVNDDGYPDVFALNMQGASHLWLNKGGTHFRDATAQYFPHTPWGAMGVVVFDFDNDERLDVFVTDMHSDMFVDLAPGAWAFETKKSDPAEMPDLPFPTGKSQFLYGNALFANRASGFDDVSDRVGVETYWPWGPSDGDLNADGWNDLFITAGMNFPYRYAVNSLLLNDGGRRFLPAEFEVGVEPRPALTQPWYEVDCGGADRGSKTCTECASPTAAAIGCRGAPDGRVTMTASKASRSSVILDLDNDGDLDIVTNEFGAPPQILLSDLTARRKITWLKVRLVGTRSNREGLGARVTVITPDQRRRLQVADGKSGYLSQSDLPLYFGLGGQATVASVEVLWPSGVKQTVPGPITVGRTLEIVEPR
jgi:hypothetical protein